jgi:hypothetical protein
MSAAANAGFVEGASFPRAIKVLATLALGGLLGSAWLARDALLATPWPADLQLLAGLAAAAVLWQYMAILLSTTRMSTEAISQGWLWRTSVPLADVAQVRLLRVKALDAWFTPRLEVRARGRGKITFQAAAPAVLAAMDLLVHGESKSG